MTVLFLYLIGITLFILSGHQIVPKLRSSERQIIVFAGCRDAVWTITMQCCYSRGIHVGPTFNFTINGTVSVFIVSGTQY